MGRYPFRAETYESIFAQLFAIINEECPSLDCERFGLSCREFIKSMLEKDPAKRANYQQLLNDKFIMENKENLLEVACWVNSAGSQTP